jgi:hypothetical protein
MAEVRYVHIHTHNSLQLTTSSTKLQSPLIALIIISALTIIPILLTTPLHLAQRKIYDPRIALLLDGFALLYWIAVFAALASYHRIFKYWGLENGAYDFDFAFCGRCRRAWRTGVAATVFSAIQLYVPHFMHVRKFGD